MNALGYLLGHSFVNSVVHRIKRLRQPKYLIGAALAAAYIYFYFYKFLFASGLNAPQKHSPEQEEMWRHTGAALLFFATLMLSWVLPSSRAAISFTEAEIAFLFPAPLTRRTLIVFKLLRSQLALLLMAVFFTFLTGRWRAGAEGWIRMGSWWFILNTLSLHRIGASFALSRLHERGLADWKRRLTFAIALGGLSFVVWKTWASLPAAPTGVGSISPYFNQLFHSGPLPWLLAPFRWVVAPYFAHDAAQFLAALPAAFALLAAHFIWVIRADASFEDAAIETARKRATLLAAARKGEVRMSASRAARIPLFRLRPTGFKPFAFLWKSLLRMGGRRALTRWTLFFCALGGAVAWLAQQHTGTPSKTIVAISIAIGFACYMAFILSFVMVGQQAAGQLRQGIAGMDLLKTYPLPGWQYALGELTGPIIVGTLIQWAALSIGSMLAFALAAKMLGGIIQPALLIIGSIAVFMPLFNLGSSILPAATALAFPGWFKPNEPGGGTQGGFEVMGLRLLIGISQLLLIAIAFVPVAFFAAAAWFASDLFTLIFAWKVAATAATAIFVLALEAACGIAWLGWLFDRFDLSGE